jgi:hypothetical protein
MVFKPLLPDCESFVCVNEDMERMPFGDPNPWSQSSVKPSRYSKYYDDETKAAIIEFSHVQQVVTLRIRVPVNFCDCLWFRNPRDITLRYPGVTVPDIQVHYSQSDCSIIESKPVVRFHLSESQRIIYADGCDVFK